MKRLLTITAVAASMTIGMNYLAAAAGITANVGGGRTTATIRRTDPTVPKPDPAPPTHHPAHAEGRWRGPCEGWWMGENLTPRIWNANPTRGRLMMQRLIACVFAFYAPGQSITALVIADRESGFYPWAANPSGCQGLFQHQVDYWAGRAAMISKKLFAPWMKWPTADDPGRLIYDPRANAIAAAKMVAASGWGAWSTA